MDLEVNPANYYEPYLLTPQVNPTIGNYTTIFNFTVWYYDDDNNLPVFVNITINGTLYAMLPIDQSDLTSTDGIHYYFTTPLDFGDYQFQINCSDGKFTNSTELVTGPQVGPFYGSYHINLFQPFNESSLFTGWTNFTWSSLDAPFGLVNYTIQISNYSDFSMVIFEANNIDETIGISNFTFYVDFDTNQYYWRVRATYYQFTSNWSDYFMFNLTYNEYEPFLNNGGVNPKVGDQYTEFTFTVLYTDLDNNAPLYVNITINDTSYKMNKVNSLDLNYVDGCLYQYLSYLSPEAFNYTYFFICSDGKYTNFTAISMDLEVNPANYNEPYLLTPQVNPTIGNYTTIFNFTVWYYDDDNNLPKYVNITINSTSYGMIQANSFDDDATDGIIYYFATMLDLGDHNFQINCSDGFFTNSTKWITNPQVFPFYEMSAISLLNPNDLEFLFIGWHNFSWFSINAPFGAVNFTLQISNNSLFSQINYEEEDISERPGRSNQSIYIDLPSGQYFWRVRPTYHKFIGNWSDSFIFIISVNSYAPTLESLGFSPAYGNFETLFKFRVVYSDQDNNAPFYVNLRLNNKVFSMEKSDSTDHNYRDGCIYQYSISLSPRRYIYSFECYDLMFTCETINFTGPYVQFGPIIDTGGDDGDNALNDPLATDTNFWAINILIIAGIGLPFVIFTEYMIKRKKLK